MREVEILELLDFYRDAPADLREEIRAAGQVAHLDEGSYSFQEGSSCTNVAFVGRGNVRVFKVSREGREITLYHVTRGETCLLTLSAAMSRDTYPASALVEAEVEAVVVPVDRFRSWIQRFPELRTFVFAEMAHRISDLMALIHEIVFRRMDRRLAAYLLRALEEQGGDGRHLQVTHGEIAAELGSAREVVSRVLKELEREGGVELGRGQIRLSDETVLRRLAAPQVAG